VGRLVWGKEEEARLHWCGKLDCGEARNDKSKKLGKVLKWGVLRERKGGSLQENAMVD